MLYGCQELICEPSIGFALDTDKWHRIPQNILHPQLMDTRHVSLHIRDFAEGHFPVSRIGITASVVHRLPAIIHNDRLAAKLFCQPALFLNSCRINLLMKAIPSRVHWPTSHLWHKSWLIARLRCPPLLDL